MSPLSPGKVREKIKYKEENKKMENKKIIEGYVASLTMATMPLFKEATKKIQDGEILSVTFTINDKSRFSRIVVNEKKLDGSETPFGKIVPADMKIMPRFWNM